MAERLLFLIPMILSLTVHEWAHAWTAYKLGDDTAAREGRLTLSPLAHLDPVGTFLLPLLGIPFGWAKPVPVNPVRFNRKVTMQTGMALTAAAGPFSNVVLAVGCAVALGAILRFRPELLAQQQGIHMLLIYGLQLNVSLALFNLFPIPPLDGSRILERFVPASMRERWEAFTRVAPFLLLGVIVLGGTLLAGPREYVSGLLYELIRKVATA